VSPLRILLSARTRTAIAQRLAGELGDQAHVIVEADEVHPGADADIAFVSRDVTGRSTKHEVLPATQRFHDLLRGARSLRWVHTHSAGADRSIFGELRARGVEVTTSSGANAGVVAQSAVAGLLALARDLPRLLAAQRERRWAPDIDRMPRDLAGQTAVIVGWGPVGRNIAALLSALGLRCIAVRRSAGAPDAAAVEIVGYHDLYAVLPRADWLVLACPLTDRTRGLIDGAALRLLPRGARIINVARGEVVVERELIAGLESGKPAGAYLDVFEHEPLPAQSPLWSLPNVIATPHCAGHSDGNEERVAQMFLANVRRWCDGVPLVNRLA
jgi:phosphoglycerate dehydrogenase-like enzyme